MVTVVLVAGGCSSATGGGNGAHAAILAPSDRSFVTSPTLRVDVQIAGRSSQVLLDSKPITSRFAATGDRDRTAVLLVGNGELAPGPHSLVVTDGDPAQRGSASIRFVVGRLDHSYINVPALPKGPLTTPVLVDASTSSPPQSVTVRLNGRNITGAFTTKGKLRQGRLGAHEGLVEGRNVLEVSADAPDGRYDTVTRTFDVATDKPIAGAGRDRLAKVGQSVQLDGRASRTSHAGSQLTHQWSVVAAPPGSKTELSNPGSARPHLQPDVNGIYQLQETVTEKGPDGKPRTAKDTVAVSAAPSDPPIGVPIATITDQDAILIDGKVVTGTDGKPVQGGDWVQIVILNNVDRSVAAARAFNLSDDPQQVSDMANYAPNIGGDKLTIITGAAHDVTGKLDARHLDALHYAFDNLGGTFRTFGNGNDPGWGNGVDPGWGDGHWSLIGIPGSSEGQANETHMSPPNGPWGSIQGYLQQNPQNFYTYVSPDYLPFDTSVPNAPAGTNQISVNGTVYTSDPVQNGFQVVVLDQGNLQPLPLGPAPSMTFNTDSISPDGADAMRKFLVSVDDPGIPALVIIQSIGAPAPPGGVVPSCPYCPPDHPPPPYPADPAWFPLASEIQHLGGTPDVFTNLSRLGHLREPYNPVGYSFVGGFRLPRKESAESFKSGQFNLPNDARLTGMLSANRQGQMRAGNASPLSVCPLLDQPGTCPSGTIDTSMLSITYEKAQGFPAWTPTQAAAGAWIADQLTLSSSPDVRSAYYQVWNPGTWSANLVALQGFNPTYCSTPATSTTTTATSSTSTSPPSTKVSPTSARRQSKAASGCVSTFTKADWDVVEPMLAGEFAKVAAVQRAIEAMRSSLTRSAGTNTWTAANVAKQITDRLRPKPQEHSDSTDLAFAIVTNVLTMGSGIPGVGPFLGSAAGAVGLAGALVGMGGNGASADAPITVDATAFSETLSEFQNNLDLGFERIGQILVSDWGKLERASYYSGEEGLWNQPDSVTINSFNTATAQLIFQSLVPLAYSSLQLGWGSDLPYDVNTYTLQAKDWICGLTVPYVDAQPAPLGQYRSLQGADDSLDGLLAFNPHVIGVAHRGYLTPDQVVPDPNLLKTLFSSANVSSENFWTPDGRGANLNPYWFYYRDLPYVYLGSQEGFLVNC